MMRARLSASDYRMRYTATAARFRAMRYLMRTSFWRAGLDASPLERFRLDQEDAQLAAITPADAADDAATLLLRYWHFAADFSAP